MTSKATDLKDLEKRINKFKRSKIFKGYTVDDSATFMGSTFGNENKNFEEENKFDWLNKHTKIEFNGEIYDIKTPTLGGMAIIYARPFLEKIYNDGFIEFNSLAKAYKKEAIKQEKLSKSNLTISAPPQLNNTYKTVVSKDSQKNYLLDRIRILNELEENETVNELVSQAFGKLAQLHQEGESWGDANLFGYYTNEKGELQIQGFALHPNELKMPQKQIFAKDFLSLFYSSILRTNLSPEIIAKTAIESYSPNELLQTHLKNESLKRAIKSGNEVFYMPVFGLNNKQINQHRNTLYELL